MIRDVKVIGSALLLPFEAPKSDSDPMWLTIKSELAHNLAHYLLEHNLVDVYMNEGPTGYEYFAALELTKLYKEVRDDVNARCVVCPSEPINNRLCNVSHNNDN